MLAADKLLLQSSIRQNSIALKEKEFNLHHGNFNAVGTQAAVLAGFTVTAGFDRSQGALGGAEVAQGVYVKLDTRAGLTVR